MVENPYKPGSTASTIPKTRPTRWLVRSGLAAITLAVVCIVSIAVGMLMTFYSLSSSPAIDTDVADFAQSISDGMLWSLAALLLGILGIALLVTGLLVRQPVDRSEDEQRI